MLLSGYIIGRFKFRARILAGWNVFVTAVAIIVLVSVFQVARLTDSHRLNMELDLQSLLGLHVHSCAHWLRLRNIPPPLFGLTLYTRALFVSQDRRHLLVNP